MLVLTRCVFTTKRTKLFEWGSEWKCDEIQFAHVFFSSDYLCHFCSLIFLDCHSLKPIAHQQTAELICNQQKYQEWMKTSAIGAWIRVDETSAMLSQFIHNSWAVKWWFEFNFMLWFQFEFKPLHCIKSDDEFIPFFMSFNHSNIEHQIRKQLFYLLIYPNVFSHDIFIVRIRSKQHKWILNQQILSQWKINSINKEFIIVQC